MVYDPEILIEETRQRYRLPGLAVSLIRDHELFTGSFGSAHLFYQIPVGESTLFGIGALTQIITACALLQLRDAGKLHLDDPIKEFLPDVDVHSPFMRTPPLTIRHLLTHVGGLPQERFEPHVRQGKLLSREEIRMRLSKIEVQFPVWSATRASDLGYALLGQVVEKVSNQRYEDYAMDAILRPAGMLLSGFDFLPPRRDRALGYTLVNDHPQICDAFASNGFVSACGGFCTAYDLAQLVFSLFWKGTNPRILCESSQREMQMPVFMAPDSQSGVTLGWKIKRIADHPVFYQQSAGDGFSSCISTMPDQRRGVIVLANGCLLDTTWTLLDLAEALLVSPFFSSPTAAFSSAETGQGGEAPGNFHVHHAFHLSWKMYEGLYTLLHQTYQVTKIAGTRDLLLQGENRQIILKPVPSYFHVFEIVGDVFDGDRASFLVENEHITQLHLGDIILKRVEER